MDDPGLDPAEHRRALAGLARINRLTNSAGLLWQALRPRAQRGPLRILDVATGSGDVPAALARLSARDGARVELHACDISETAIAAAEARAPNVQFFRHDVLREPLPGGFDAVTCSLFLHHLSEAEAEALLRAMAGAGRFVVVNDLARGRFNLCAVWLACRVLSRSPVVHFDGPVSVRQAFTVPEAQALAERAGLCGASVVSKFPCRWLLEWEKPG
jgi:SAM-dependent methyltransferase